MRFVQNQQPRLINYAIYIYVQNSKQKFEKKYEVNQQFFILSEKIIEQVYSCTYILIYKDDKAIEMNVTFVQF